MSEGGRPGRARRAGHLLALPRARKRHVDHHRRLGDPPDDVVQRGPLAALDGPITERGNRVFFFRANAVMCAQLFHVARFLPERGALLSLVAPYRCLRCNAEGELELWLDDAEKSASVPTMPCLKCGGLMTLDHDDQELRDLLSPFFGRPVPEDVRAAVGR